MHAAQSSQHDAGDQSARAMCAVVERVCSEMQWLAPGALVARAWEASTICDITGVASSSMSLCYRRAFFPSPLLTIES